MRSLLLVFIAGCAIAVPHAAPQEFDWDNIDAAPNPTLQGAPVGAKSSLMPEMNSVAMSSSIAAAITTDTAVPEVKRDLDESGTSMSKGCQVQPTGCGPLPTPDTADAFWNDPGFAATASSASTPQGYSQSFVNLKGSTQSSDMIGYTTLQSYDAIACQAYCDAQMNCFGFNIYYERDPKVDPCNAACANGPSTNVIKCVAWGSQQSLDPALATNTGQWRGPEDADGQAFHVVIAASNGYQKMAPPPWIDGFTGPSELGGAINAPLLTSGFDSFLRSKFFPGSYDASKCAIACQAQTLYNSLHPPEGSGGDYQHCFFFNAYVLSENNIPQGMNCALYSTQWAKSYGTNYGQYRGGNRYSVSQSYGYTVDGYVGYGPDANWRRDTRF